MLARPVVFALLLASACTTGTTPDGASTGDPEAPGVAPGGPTTESSPTWHGTVAPLMAEHCAACHVEGGIAPFALTTYEQAYPWRQAVAEAVAAGTMPPFDADETETCTPEHGWLNERRLPPAAKDAIATWVADGAPEGDPTKARPLVPPEPDRIEAPDAVVSIQEPFVLEGDDDVYMCFRVPIPHDDDVWLTGVQVLPDNDRIVHHVLVWHDPLDQSAQRAGADGAYRCSGTPDLFPTDLVGAWTPGNDVLRTPPGTGTLFKAGGSLVINVHYHPTGAGPETDQTGIAVQWTTEQPSKHVTWYLADLPFGASMQPSEDGETSFRIPANEPAHVETHVLDTRGFLPFPVQIYAVSPHMHYLGRDMQVTIRRGDPAQDECLVHTPTYRFDWQTTYVYDAPLSELPTIYPGDVLEVRCTYDNSWSNPNLPVALAAAGRSEPGDVTWGEETGDEMCMAMLGLVIPPLDLGSILSGLGY